jgi:hypothetical protein
MVGRGGVGLRALLLRARVRVQRVRVHGREAGASFHEAVEVERYTVAGRADLDASDLVAVR